MSDIIQTIQPEIARLERELEGDPRFQKLRHLRELMKLYGGESAPRAAPKPLSHRAGSSPTGRRRDPERQKLFEQIDLFLTGKTQPIRTAEIFDYLTLMGFEIPGKEPRSNLSAMIFNSNRYQSHGRQGWTLQAPMLNGDASSAQSEKQEGDWTV